MTTPGLARGVALKLQRHACSCPSGITSTPFGDRLVYRSMSSNKSIRTGLYGPNEAPDLVQEFRLARLHSRRHALVHATQTR